MDTVPLQPGVTSPSPDLPPEPAPQTPPQIPPEIREPVRPGEQLPITDTPRL